MHRKYLSTVSTTTTFVNWARISGLAVGYLLGIRDDASTFSKYLHPLRLDFELDFHLVEMVDVEEIFLVWW